MTRIKRRVGGQWQAEERKKNLKRNRGRGGMEEGKTRREGELSWREDEERVGEEEEIRGGGWKRRGRMRGKEEDVRGVGEEDGRAREGTTRRGK
jgi:hypothetical protein